MAFYTAKFTFLPFTQSHEQTTVASYILHEDLHLLLPVTKIVVITEISPHYYYYYYYYLLLLLIFAMALNLSSTNSKL